MPARKKNSSSRSQTRSRTRTQTDAIALLKQDHQKVRGLLRRLESSTGRNTNQRDELLQQIENEVKIHTTIEEEIFYPAFKEAARRTDMHLYFEAMEEHHVVDMVMPEIKATGSDSEEFVAKGKVLKDLIEHHAEEEETQMFPKARKLMGAAQLRELGEQMQERKQQLMGGIFGRVVGKGRGAVRSFFQPETGNARSKKKPAA